MIHSKTEVQTHDVATHYNELDYLYRQVWGEHLHHGLWQSKTQSKDEATKELVRMVAREMNVKPGQKVCDIGCGYGATSRMLAQVWEADVLGITISESQFKHISSKHPTRPNLQFRLMDWLKNDLKDQSFDHLLSIESSEHMPDKKRFFSEASRLLKPGGSFVICAWLSKNHPSSFEKRFLLEPICREGKLPCLASETEYKEFFQSTGFESVTFKDVTSKVKKTWYVAIKNFIEHLMKNPKDVKLLSKSINSNAPFLKSLFRIQLSYEIGSMRYGIFKGIKKA